MGTIMVYDKELKYFRRIQLKDVGQVKDISADVYGNLYMTGCSNACIQVFSTDGVFLSCISCDKNKLKKPWGVCVSDLTDTTNNCVAVFTIDDAYVTSFGQHGNKEGDFNRPYYLYFVYVCDCWNNRIQCF